MKKPIALSGCQFICPQHKHFGGTLQEGPITKIRFGGKVPAVTGTMAYCRNGSPNVVKTGSSKIRFGGHWAARLNDAMAHGKIIEGDAKFRIG